RDVYSALPDSGAIFGSQLRSFVAGSESRARAQRPSQPKKTRLLRVLHSANLLSSRLRLDRTEEILPCAHLNGLAAYLDIGQVVRVEAQIPPARRLNVPLGRGDSAVKCPHCPGSDEADTRHKPVYRTQILAVFL